MFCSRASSCFALLSSNQHIYSVTSASFRRQTAAHAGHIERLRREAATENNLAHRRRYRGAAGTGARWRQHARFDVRNRRRRRGQRERMMPAATSCTDAQKSVVDIDASTVSLFFRLIRIGFIDTSNVWQILG